MQARFTARAIDSVVHLMMVLIILFGYHALFVPADDELTLSLAADGRVEISTGGNVVDKFAGAPNLGPVSVGWKAAITLVLCVVAIGLSEAAQTWALGSTVGKRWNQVRIYGLHGGRVSPAQVAIRGAALAVPVVITASFWFESVLYGWIGAAAMVFFWIYIKRDPRQRGLHDKLAGTEVFSTDVRGEILQVRFHGERDE